ncbi:PAS domain-containing protein [Anabaena sphaerica FACHB-251]|uniref:histidine kinase n=1 Tax=Anabaena sphaerica FACHB-251 TaxID=2692883 RepID=A0A926WH94_9NOST|nr:PAS domain-containing protein [Anabaena sphaerica]MBD2294540.1 PAS domain-containing protein [Anabaena sphaerica FACHB-251]
MNDHHKTKTQLITELEALRAEVAALKEDRLSRRNLETLEAVEPRQYTILIVDDSETDRFTYHRYLSQNHPHIYKIVEFDNGEEALLWCQNQLPDVMLIDYFLPDMDGLEFLQELRQQTDKDRIPVIMITGQGNTEVAVDLFKSGAQDYLDKNHINAENLHQAITNVVRQTQLIQQQEWQQQRQQLITKTALSIRNSLKIDDILQTTVTEIRAILESDRIIIYQFQADGTGLVIKESAADQAFSILNWVIKEECFPEMWIEPYRQGKNRTIDDVNTDPSLTECHREFLTSLMIRANLIVPIIQGENLWGLLIAHECTAPRNWTTADVEFMNQLAIQVGIAIQQASLIEKLQTELAQRKRVEVELQQLNIQLEQRVAERTAQLAQANDQLQIELLQRDQLERELRNREKLLDGFFYAASQANVGLSIVDTNLRFLKINQALAAINGYSIEAHLGKSSMELLPEISSEILPILQTVLDTKQPIANLEISGIVPSQPQVIRYWLVSYFPILGETGNPIALGTIVIEISDRKRLELEREKLIGIIEATSDIISTVRFDTQKIEYINKAGRRLLNLADDAPIDHISIADIHPQWSLKIIQNQGIPAAVRYGVWVGETALINHQGREVPISQVLIAQTFDSNHTQYLSTIARDITQQKQSEAALKESDRRWKSLLDNVQLVVIGLDANGNVEYANPFFLQLTDYTETEILGNNWFNNFLPPNQNHLMETTFLEVIEKNCYPHYQNPILTKSGEERMISWSNTLLRDVEGNPIGTISIGEDITERYRLERIKAEFIAVVSHELRTPLTSMQAGLSLLHDKIIDANSPEGEATIEIATEGVDRLVRLVNDILDLERLESGKINLEKSVFNTIDLINTAIAQMQDMAILAGIILNATPSSYQVDADPDRLLQVIINLLSNAIKFSPPRSNVWLTVEVKGRGAGEQGSRGAGEQGSRGAEGELSTQQIPYLLFTVKDQGRGIPINSLESIFDRFHQVDASDSRSKGGTGLGLAICRNIVEQHGGTIWAESVLGEGSTFYFTLPIEEVSNEK